MVSVPIFFKEETSDMVKRNLLLLIVLLMFTSMAWSATVQEKFDHAALARKAGNITDAIAGYEAVIADPASSMQMKARSQSEIGYCLMDVSRYDDAAAAFGKALTGYSDLGEDLVDYQRAKSFALRMGQHYTEALSELQAIVSKYKDSARFKTFSASNVQHEIGILLLDLGKTDEALATLRNVPLISPVVSTDALQGSQYNISKIYMLQGKTEQALFEAKVLYNICPLDRLNTAFDQVTAVLKGIDFNLARADEFMLYQKCGSAGKDGTSGTADDLVNPLAGVSNKESGRNEIYISAIKKSGDSYNDLRLKGYLLLLCDKTKDAIPVFKQAFVVAGAGEIDIAVKDMAAAIKALDGSPIRANIFLQSQKEPFGPDGIKGTADDPPDILKELQ